MIMHAIAGTSTHSQISNDNDDVNPLIKYLIRIIMEYEHKIVSNGCASVANRMWHKVNFIT